MKEKIIILLGLLLLGVGCAKAPDRIENPVLNIYSSIENNQELYYLTISGILQNENSGRVLKNIRGNLVFTDPGTPAVEKIEFKIDRIMPFNAEAFNITRTGDKQSMTKLFDILGLDPATIPANKTGDTYEIDERLIKLEDIKFETIDIESYIKGKSK